MSILWHIYYSKYIWYIYMRARACVCVSLWKGIIYIYVYIYVWKHAISDKLTIIVLREWLSIISCYDRHSFHLNNEPYWFHFRWKDMLQKVLEKHLEKKAGRNYGPTGTKLLIYFIDDMNMPEVDMYGTVQPHTLIRQHMDYNHW